MKLDFRDFTEAVLRINNPFDPLGRGAKTVGINRVDPEEIEHLKAARDALQDKAMGNTAVISALGHLQKAMMIVGQASPHYKMLTLAADYLSKQGSGAIPVDLARSLQAIDVAIKQINQAA